MPRPGFVLEVDDKTPPILMIGGTRLHLQRFGSGTKVAYGSEGEPSSDPAGLIAAALNAPIEGAPLGERLAGCRRLTIVFGDGTKPARPMKFEVRREVVERVLESAARAGVDDVELVAATGLRRRLTDDELTRLLGERVMRSFAADGLVRSHDAVDDVNLAVIGEVAGHSVRINRRVAESDLVVNVVLRADASGTPLDQLVCGLGDVATIDFVAGFEGRATPERASGVAQLIERKVPVVTIEVVLGPPTYDRPLGFLGKREWEWSAADQLSWVGLRQLIAAAPKQASTRLFGNLRADYAIHDVIVGEPQAVERQARQVWLAGNAAPLPGDADVLVTSVWGIGQDSTDPVGSPLAAAHQALVVAGGAADPQPRAKAGAALVAFHPLINRFSNRHHTAAADFFAELLPETRDSAELRARFQDRYAADPWYLELYRRQNAYHPLHVFHQWYATWDARQRFGDVIWVGGDRRSAAVLGHRAATTYADALEIASNTVGAKPSVLVLR